MVTSDATPKYDKLFAGILHYQKYPVMLPWVGSHYGRGYKKVLLIGESHYLPDGSTIQRKVDGWYNGSQDRLSKDEIEYICTRDVLRAHYREGGIWGELGKVMFEHRVLPPESSDNVYDNFAWYNYFQRPAENEGKGIEIHERDTVEANSVLRANIAILNPEIVVFLSSKAWNNVLKGDKALSGVSLDFVPHPSHQWWNRKTMKYSIDKRHELTGREKFGKLTELFKTQ
jgi:hypothetical protein